MSGRTMHGPDKHTASAQKLFQYKTRIRIIQCCSKFIQLSSRLLYLQWNENKLKLSIYQMDVICCEICIYGDITQYIIRCGKRKIRYSRTK